MLRDLAPRFFGLCLVTVVACGGAVKDGSNDQPGKITIEAKVIGTVTLREGDCMPITTPERCRIKGIATRVEAYGVIHLEKGSPSSRDFVPAPGTKPVATTTSDADGRFSMVLPEGRYTIVTFYDGEWYPRRYGEGEWAAVEVNAGWLEDVKIVINRATE